jgi:hypothetical protein
MHIWQAEITPDGEPDTTVQKIVILTWSEAMTEIAAALDGQQEGRAYKVHNVVHMGESDNYKRMADMMPVAEG